MDNQRQVKTAVFLGVHLLWNLGTELPTACLRRVERFQRETAKRRQKAAYLAGAMSRTRSKRIEHADIRTSIAELMERQRLGHLIRITGGTDTEKE